mgnify:CR=1 FL=1|jgi:hypothetical protein|tara:strand:- start:9193 stop:9396 length:204 start_codon:yes stop_codon:yes gene_type:complete
MTQTTTAGTTVRRIKDGKLYQVCAPSNPNRTVVRALKNGELFGQGRELLDPKCGWGSFGRHLFEDVA